LLCHFQLWLSTLPDTLATHRVTDRSRRWVVAVAHEITGDRIGPNGQPTGTGRVIILEERITSYLGIPHTDSVASDGGVTNVEVAADSHSLQSYLACRPSDGHVPVDRCVLLKMDFTHAVP